MRFRYYFTIAKLILIVFTPIVLLILPADFFDSGQSICLSKLLFNTECFACGLTRASMHLVHFEFQQASSYNMLCFIAVPLLAVIWVQWFFKEWKLYKRYRVGIITSNPS
jgi:hypothetical protein